jgi:hypothetical protein
MTAIPFPLTNISLSDINTYYLTYFLPCPQKTGSKRGIFAGFGALRRGWIRLMLTIIYNIHYIATISKFYHSIVVKI